MTVKELIKTLNSIQDKQTRVMIKGYEGGLDDIRISMDENNTPEIYTVRLNVNTEWCLGRHELTEHDTPLKKDKVVRTIIL